MDIQARKVMASVMAGPPFAWVIPNPSVARQTPDLANRAGASTGGQTPIGSSDFLHAYARKTAFRE